MKIIILFFSTIFVDCGVKTNRLENATSILHINIIHFILGACIWLNYFFDLPIQESIQHFLKCNLNYLSVSLPVLHLFLFLFIVQFGLWHTWLIHNYNIYIYVAKPRIKLKFEDNNMCVRAKHTCTFH